MSITAPWLPRASDAVRQPALRHVWTVTAHPRTGPPIPLAVENGQLTFDESWSPHVQADLTLQVPLDQDTLDALDPREGCRIRISAGYRYPGGREDVHPIADLVLTDRDVSRPGNRMTLRGTSDEALVLDSVALTPATPPATGVAEAIAWALQVSIPGAQNIVNTLGAGYRPDLLADMFVSTGESYWSLITALTDAAGIWVYEDGSRTWRIRQRPVRSSRSSLIASTGANGTVLRSDATLNRRDWYNAVVVRHYWKTTAGDDRAVYGRARVTGGSPMNPATTGMKALVIDRDVPISQAAANTAAGSLLARTISRGRGLSVDVANAPYWTRPGDTVAVQLPTGPQVRQLVASIAYRFPAGDATITTRQPENVDITTGE